MGVRFCIAMLCLLASVAHGTAVNERIRDMSHKAWSVTDGAPADIWDIKQGPQGFLWLATGNGLYRFDGLRYERYPLLPGEGFRSEDMTALRLTGTDDLWVGTFDGYVSHVSHGRVTNYPADGSAPQGPVFNFVAMPDGDLWIASGDGLQRTHADGVERIGAAYGFPPNLHPMWLLLGRDQTLWAATESELLYLPRDAHRFERTGIPLGMYAVLAESPDGTLWVSDVVYGTRALPGLSASHVPPQLQKTPPVASFAQAKRIMFDASGSLWGSPNSGNGILGVFRLHDPARHASGLAMTAADITDTFTQADGLTSAIAGAMMTDNQGDVWVGTNFGLNAFHDTYFHIASPAADASPTQAWVSPPGEGNVLILQAGCLYEMQHAQPSKLNCGLPLQQYAVFRAGDHFYTDVTHGLVQWTATTPPVTLPHPQDGTQEQFRAATVDGTGAIWASMKSGLYRLVAGAWERAGPAQESRGPTALAFDASGIGWFGYADGTILRYDGERTQRYTVAEGLDTGPIEGIAAMDGTLMVGGDHGAAIWHGDRFITLPSSRLRLDAAVTGMALSRAGDWWLNTTRGVVQIPKAQLQRLLADTSYAPSYRLYSADDGFRGIALKNPLWSTITRDGDGRLWFSTNQGVAWVDPERLPPRGAPPRVHIDAIEADGKHLSTNDNVVLPAMTTALTLQYTAPSFVAPHRVQFRYWLEGADKAWQDGGTARQATYANLRPGDYVFHIVATDSEGVASSAPTTLAFRIEAAFYQTLLFRFAAITALVLIALSGVVAAHRISLRRVRDRLSARHAEREQIARDLHDTLLQSVQGLLLFCQAVADRIRPGDPMQSYASVALSRAEDILTEGRERVQEMRSNVHEPCDLVGRLAHVGETLAGEYGVDFGLVQIGDAQHLVMNACEEIFLIGREALRNAFTHAHACRVEVEFEYGVDRFALRIYDDGTGIPPDVLAAGAREGHFGLPGMQERAQYIQGRLSLLARASAGTQVVLEVPGNAIYLHPRLAWRGMAWLRTLLSWGR
jgi:signal transduction histidine kinase/ligand-binding sensor domain-containing protein